MTSPTVPEMPVGNTGKILSRRIRKRDRSIVIVNYASHESHAIRALAQSIRLKDDTRPSLSLLSRRALQLYLSVYPQAAESETAALNKMVTRHPSPAPSTTKSRKV